MKLTELAIKKRKVLDGDINPLEFLTQLNELEKAIKDAKEEILNDAILEFDRHGAKSIIEYGFEISATQSGRYDYTNNSDWNMYKNKMKDIESKMQAAYKNNASILDDNTGEVYEAALYKANKPSLKLKKLK